MSRPGQIKGHKTSCKHSDSLYKMDPSKSSQGWFSQEVFYLKSFLFPWRRASMNFKWKPSLRLKGTQLQQSSCSLSCHQQRLISPGARRVLLLHCSCTSLQLASYPCFHWPLKNSILLGKKNQLQNHWKTVPFCSHYQGLSTALWAPFHLSLNKPFPLLIFHITQGCQIQWAMKCTFWKAPSIAFIQNLWKLWWTQNFRSASCLMQTKVR